MRACCPNLQAQNAGLPFKGKQQGQFSFTPMTLEAGLKTVEITATGPASQFGMSRTVIHGDVDLDADLRPTPRPPGSWTLTAANGDKVEGEFVWRGTPTGTFGVFTLDGTYRITGGTGRIPECHRPRLGDRAPQRCDRGDQLLVGWPSDPGEPGKSLIWPALEVRAPPPCTYQRWKAG